MVTYPYAYMTYIVSPLAGLGGGISWWPPAYSLLNMQCFSTENVKMFVMIHLLTWNVATDHRINLWDSKVWLLRLLTKDNWLTRGDNHLKKNIDAISTTTSDFCLSSLFHRLLQVRSGSTYVFQTFGDCWCKTSLQAECPSSSPNTNSVKALKRILKNKPQYTTAVSIISKPYLPFLITMLTASWSSCVFPPVFHCKLINRLVMLIFSYILL